MIKKNLDEVKKSILEVEQKAHIPITNTTLIAVSKTKPIELILEAYEAGMRDFGENKVQELCDKIEKLPKDIRWHMIGHLQKNKVKYVVGKVVLIHSVDSLELAEIIDKQAKKENLIQDVLIEVNIGKEESKFGVFPEDTLDLILQVASLKNIHIKGLMTVAPATDISENQHFYFRKMHQLYVDIKSKNIDNISMEILSMGMTGDYKVAIEEGATMVRIGTKIFGERNYSLSE